MKKDTFKKGIKDIHKIRLTDAEKSVVLARILEKELIKVAGTGLVKSPWSIFSFHVWFKTNTWVYSTLILAVVLFTGGGVAFASKNTLPGDVLYAIKVNIVEPVYGSFIKSDIAKAKWESGLATERLKEAEVLASQGRLDKSKQQEISTLLSEHTKAFSVSIGNAEKNLKIKKVEVATPAKMAVESFDVSSQAPPQKDTQQDEQVSEVKLDFKAKLGAHAKLLRVIANERAQTSSDNLGAQTISDEATNSSNSTSTGSLKNGRSYETHKDEVKMIIKKTKDDLDGVASSGTSFVRSVASTTSKYLDEAMDSMDTADWHQDRGHTEEASSQLLQSEQKATEANVLLDAGLELERDNPGKSGRGR